MTALEIVLLLIGIICVAASFIFFTKMDGSENIQRVNVELSEKQREDIKQQIATVYQEKMDEMTDKVMDSTEASLEKLSNKKIQELSEYSDTVLSDINKNHNEVMFLYDMLNEKSKEVHNNIRDINIAVDKLKEAQTQLDSVTAMTAAAVEPATAEPKKAVAKKSTTTRKKSTKAVANDKEKKDAMNEAASNDRESDTDTKAPTVNTEFMMGAGKKEAVLTLYNEGKSNVEIAKTLGLGVGEVKLVIDLFKGQK